MIQLTISVTVFDTENFKNMPSQTANISGELNVVDAFDIGTVANEMKDTVLDAVETYRAEHEAVEQAEARNGNGKGKE